VSCALIGLLSTPVFADDPPYVPPDFMSATPPLPPGQDAASAWRLDLAEALRVAVKQNLDVTLERRSVEAAELGIDVAGGAFEPNVSASYVHDHANSPPTTSQEGMPGQIYQFVNDLWRLSLGQRLSTGTQLSLDFGNGRAKSSLGTAVEPLNYRTTLGVTITQPLLRGMSLDRTIPRIDVLRAQLASDRERKRLAVVVTDVVERTEDAYWEVVQALYRRDLELRSQQRAEEQLALTERQIAAGILPPSDVIGAKSTLAARRLQLVQADGAVEQAWDALRAVLNLPRDQWTRPILPIDVPRFAPEMSTPDDALATAIKHRPELEQQDLELAASELAVRKAENDKLPQVDLGLGATVIGQDPAYPGALDQLSSADARSWNVSVNLTWTPLRRASSAAAEIERTRHAMTVATREQLVQRVWFEVRDALRNLSTAARQVSAAAKFRELAVESLEVEQRRFLNGTSQNIIVAQRQEELASAQLAELAAVLAHKKATASYLRATGRLLDERHIELAVKKP
jgi:HAE1 family hydrophobic/amphiphilic exporter-1